MIIYTYDKDYTKKQAIEVPDEEAERWVEDDYQRRKAEAQPGEIVNRRTAQQIMDEEINKPSFYSVRNDEKNCVSLEAFTEGGIDFAAPDNTAAVISREDPERIAFWDTVEGLTEKQKGRLDLRLQGVSKTETAKIEGVTEQTIDYTFDRLEKKFARFLGVQFEQ